MKLASMTTREQLLVLVAAGVLLGSAYGLLRYRPALKALAELQAQTRQTEERLETMQPPIMPDEDAATLSTQLAEADAKLAASKTRMAEVEQGLPPGDAQEILLKLSELATASNLLVRENAAYMLTTKAAANAAAAPKARSSSRSDRRAARAERKAARAAGRGAAANGFLANGAFNASELPQPESGTPGVGLEMLERYAQPEYARPLQRVSLEGYYADIRYFLDELQKLPWQVTVAQLQIEVGSRPAEPGMPQPLRATLVLAL